MNYKDFRQQALGKLCRDCINQQYGVNVERKECYYLPNPYPCRCCGEMRYIVNELSFAGRCKIVIKKEQNE